MLSPELDHEHEYESGNEEHWIAVSDLMSGLMMLFLLIAVMYLVIAERKNQEIERVVVLYEDLKEELYQDLLLEFEQDLPRWGAPIACSTSPYPRMDKPSIASINSRKESRHESL